MREQRSERWQRLRQWWPFVAASIALCLLAVALWAWRRGQVSSIEETASAYIRAQSTTEALHSALRNQARIAVTAAAGRAQTADARQQEAQVAQATLEAQLEDAVSAQSTAEAGLAEAAVAQATATAELAWAEEQGQLAMSRRLAGEAESLRLADDGSWNLAGLLAAEALRRDASSGEAVAAAYHVLEQVGRHVASFSFEPDIYRIVEWRWVSDWPQVGAWVEVRRSADPESAYMRAYSVLANTREVTQIEIIQLDTFPLSASVSPDGNYVAATVSNTVWLWDIARAAEVYPLGTEAAKQLDHQQQVKRLQFSPDGRRLATHDGSMVRLWDTASGKNTVSFEHKAPIVLDLIFSTDGRYLATHIAHQRLSGGSPADVTVGLWDTASGEQVMQSEYEGRADLAFSPDGERLAVSGGNTLTLWDTSTGRHVTRIHGQDSDDACSTSSRSFSPDSRWLMTHGALTVCVWDAKTGDLVARLMHESRLVDARFTPKGRYLLTRDASRVWVRDVGEAIGTQVSALEHAQRVLTAVSPDDRWLVTAGLDQVARVWALETGREVARLAHPRPLGHAVFSPDGRWLATTDRDATARLWAVADLSELGSVAKPRLYLQHGPPIDEVVYRWGDFSTRVICPGIPTAVHVESCNLRVEFGPNESYVWTRLGNQVRVWDISPLAAEGISGGERLVGLPDLEFSPDGRWGVAVLSDTVRVWDAWRLPSTSVLIDAQVASLHHAAPVRETRFSADSQFLATQTTATLSIWDTSTWMQVAGAAQDAEWQDTAYSTDLRLFAAADGSTVHLWDVWAGSEFAQLDYSHGIWSMSFGPRGHGFVLRDFARAQIWDLSRALDAGEYQEVARFEYQGEPAQVFFSPTGRWWAVPVSSTVWLRDTTTGKEFSLEHEETLLPGFPKAVFSADETLMATLSRDVALEDTITIWDLPTVEKRLEIDACWLQFSPDGQWAAVISEPEGLAIWDIRTGKAVFTQGHYVSCRGGSSSSSDGRYLILGDSAGSALLYDLSDVQSGQVRTWRFPPTSTHLKWYFLTSLEMSPDGRWIAWSAEDDIRQLWDVEQGRSVLSWPVGTVDRFSNDGRLLVASDGVWVGPSGLLDRLCLYLPRNMTQEEWSYYIGDEPYRQTCPNLPFHESAIWAMLDRAEALAAKGDPQAALAYGRIVEQTTRWRREPDVSSHYRICYRVCLSGTYRGFAAAVLPACDQAVGLEPRSAELRDCRGVARVLTGDYAGAVADFRFVVERWETVETREQQVREREVWIARLERGQNPFGSDGLEGGRDK